MIRPGQWRKWVSYSNTTNGYTAPLLNEDLIPYYSRIIKITDHNNSCVVCSAFGVKSEPNLIYKIESHTLPLGIVEIDTEEMPGKEFFVYKIKNPSVIETVERICLRLSGRADVED